MEEMLLSASKLQKESNKTKLTCPGLKRTLMPDQKSTKINFTILMKKTLQNNHFFIKNS